MVDHLNKFYTHPIGGDYRVHARRTTHKLDTNSQPGRRARSPVIILRRNSRLANSEHLRRVARTNKALS